MGEADLRRANVAPPQASEMPRRTPDWEATTLGALRVCIGRGCQCPLLVRNGISGIPHRMEVVTTRQSCEAWR